MTYPTFSRAGALVAALGIAFPVTAPAQSGTDISKRALIDKGIEIVRTIPSQPIDVLAAPGDDIVLNARTLCFNANNKQVKCPDKITIRQD